MEILNPLMFWGILAISIPIIIHFWHQKKGKVIEWAASQWLIEKKLQQSRGLRLDNWLLLLLRCLLLLLLCFFLSKPILNWLNKDEKLTKIHLIQPNDLVLSNFKFEIENAIKNGEKCYWIDSKTTQINDLKQKPFSDNFDANLLQNSLNNIGSKIENENLELYFISSKSLENLPQIFVPTSFNLHIIADTNSTQKTNFLSFSNNKKLFVDASNQLKVSMNANGKQIHVGAIKVLLKNNQVQERQSIKAALKALTDVYQFEFEIDEKEDENKNYEIVFDNKMPQTTHLFNVLYFYSGTNLMKKSNFPEQENIIYLPNLLLPQTSEIVFNGNLPEFLGEAFIKHFDLQPTKKTLSNQQINSLFKAQTSTLKAMNQWFSKAIILIFILLLSVERWLAIHKKA